MIIKITDNRNKYMEPDELDALFSEENIPESDWFKMNKVGDKVAGIVVEIEERPAKDDFAPQRVFFLKQKDGSIIKYGAKYPKMVDGKMQGSDYLINRTNKVKPGDKVGFQFMKEIAPTKAGRHPAKSIEVYITSGTVPVQTGDFNK